MKMNRCNNTKIIHNVFMVRFHTINFNPESFKCIMYKFNRNFLWYEKGKKKLYDFVQVCT